MAHFNSAKNPPWARQNEFVGVQQTQPQLQQMINPNLMQYSQQSANIPNTQQVYQAQMALQQQALSMHPFVNSAQSIYNPAVSGMAQTNVARTMNIVPSPVIVQQSPVIAQSSSQQQQSNRDTTSNNSTAKQQRVFTGTVTKVVDSYGFVDEDVFFQMSCVKGPTPVLHDRVLVEAMCLPGMPFKWNATRVQVLPMNEGGNTRKRPLSPRRDDRTAYPTISQPDDNRRERDMNRERERDRDRDLDRSRGPSPGLEERRRRRERREREEKEREREKESRARTRSRSRSPRRSRISPLKKYRVRIPEHSLDLNDFTVNAIKARYSSLYIPSDFFSASTRWPDLSTTQRPLQLSGSVRFHIVDKEIAPVFTREDLVEPPDADFLFSAKVMLLSIPSKEELIRRCVQMADEKESTRRTHAARLIDCVVGVNIRNKNEYMAIGGPWSPSLDGADPANDPSVLIKTAIRCCRALTGVDLSSVTKWYRFAELHYHRAKSTYKGKEVPARVETVVIFTPDVWPIMPSSLEWDGLHLNYQRALDARLAELGAQPTLSSSADDDKESDSVEVKEPTHWSKLDMKSIKVAQLREELVARNQSPKGLRLQLIARLGKILKVEQDAEEAAAKERKEDLKNEKKKEKPQEDKKLKEKDDKDKEKDKAKDRVSLVEKYKLPEPPHIILHPCRKAKGGKFNCKVICLSLLLDYNHDVNKEHTFEVSLFAESLNEMIMRDFGLQIYQALCSIPEKIDDKKEDVKDEEKTESKNEPSASKRPKVEEEDKTADNSSEKKDEKANDKDVKEDEKAKENESTKDEKNGKVDGEDKNDDEDANVNGQCHGKEEDTEERRRKRRSEKEKKKKEKMETINPELLLAFTYFDTGNFGKISPNDLEELLQTLGLHLSRSQIKKLAAKVPASESYLDYRRLTDNPVKVEGADDDEMGELSLAEAVHEAGCPLPTDLGNKPLLPQFTLKPPTGKPTTTSPGKKSRPNVPSEPDDGFVYYNGSLLSVANLLEQVKKNETDRLKTEEKSLDLRHELDEAKSKLEVLQSKLKIARKELESSQKKLNVTEDTLSRELASSDIYLTTLMDVQERIMPILDTDELKRLCRLRQEVQGAPQINLVPLAKLEAVSVEDVEIVDNFKSEHEDVKLDIKKE